MYLLKPGDEGRSVIPTGAHSHSTMYLLKLRTKFDNFFQFPHSHSTMYLLKPFRQKIFLDDKNIFTFHHVSIKTNEEKLNDTGYVNSHSTMYLLKRPFRRLLSCDRPHSHSTMYLLKRITRLILTCR